MPRLFPSFTRSREHVRDDYSGYNDYGHYEQSRHQHTPAWRKVIPNLKGGNHRSGRNEPWDESFVNVDYPDYAESYGGGGGDDDDYFQNSHHYPATYDYDHQSESTLSPHDDRYIDRYDNNIPIVQRESSLTRLAEAFAGYGASTRPVTEVSLPQGTPRYSPREVPSASPAELRNNYPERHHPGMVPPMAAQSVQADIIRSHSRREHRHHHHHRSRQEEWSSRPRDDYMQDSSSDRSLDELEDHFPSCYIAVRRARRRDEKDTYYVVPGGVPVIFEDDHGNELTRVGDFSGRYQYRPLDRPVIIQDDQGREVGRLGFDDESSLDYNPRRYGSSSGSDDDDYYEDDGYHRHRHRDPRYDERGSMRSHHSRQSEPQRVPRAASSISSSTSFANVIYIAPSDAGSVAGRGTSRHSGRSSRSRSGSVGAPAIIDLDKYISNRKKSGSVSSGTSSGRSYDSARRR